MQPWFRFTISPSHLRGKYVFFDKCSYGHLFVQYSSSNVSEEDTLRAKERSRYDMHDMTAYCRSLPFEGGRVAESPPWPRHLTRYSMHTAF